MATSSIVWSNYRQLGQDKTGHRLTYYTADLPPPLSQASMDHEPSSLGGAVQKGFRSFPQPPQASTIQPQAGSSGHVSACLLPPASCLQSKSEQEGASGLLPLCCGGRWGPLARLTGLRDQMEWAGRAQTKLTEAPSLQGSHSKNKQIHLQLLSLSSSPAKKNPRGKSNMDMGAGV